MQPDWTGRDVRRGKLVLTTLDAHAAGEPLRIVTGGLPELPGATVLDHLRRALMHEPRGHSDMYGC
jgi:proline racemase